MANGADADLCYACDLLPKLMASVRREGALQLLNVHAPRSLARCGEVLSLMVCSGLASFCDRSFVEHLIYIMYALNTSLVHHQSAALTRSHVQKRNLEGFAPPTGTPLSLGLA